MRAADPTSRSDGPPSMRVLVVVIGTYGDVLPFIGLGAELKRRGHEVIMSCAETFGPSVRRAGLAFEPLTTDAEYRALFEDPDFWRPFVGARLLFKKLPTLLQPTYDFIVRHRDGPNTLVLASSLAIGARLAEEKFGVPVVSAHLTPIMFISRTAPSKMPFMPLPSWLPGGVKLKIQKGLYTEFIAPLLVPALNRFRASIGLKPRRRIRSWWHASRRMLLLFPDWFAPIQPDWPAQARQFDFPKADAFGASTSEPNAELEAFLAAGDKPVAVTFGSARFSKDRFYRAAIEACAALGKRCLLLSHQEVELPPHLAAHAFSTRYAPLGEVLPRCAALVHHGGIGTVSQAFAAGVPQLIVPFAFDQFDHAARVRRLNCGESIFSSRFTAARATRALGRLLSSSDVAASCSALARASRGSNAISDACDAIEQEFAAGPEPRSERD